MLHAAALLTGLCVLWLLATQRLASAQDAGVALGAALFCVALASRLGGAGSGFARAPQILFAAVRRVGAVLRGAISVVRAAVAADVTLRPALVRVRTRSAEASDRAAFANMISATPGMAVVECDPDGLLVHVIDEEAMDPADLGRLEHTISRGGER